MRGLAARNSRLTVSGRFLGIFVFAPGTLTVGEKITEPGLLKSLMKSPNPAITPLIAKWYIATGKLEYDDSKRCRRKRILFVV